MNKLLRATFCAALVLVPICASAATGVSGDRKTISGGGDRVPCVSSRDQLHAMIEAVRIRDIDGYNASIADAAVLHSGDRVLILKNDGFMLVDTEIRLLSGPYAGAACWVDSELPLFK